ncbi:hypothetical protein LCGC14_0940240 [marine sediment metagenome]|uniref:Uncharacterized protein n=1 Tax=marine sediment metagenome TaxID=412755 RepID=A0A0F9P6E6_9ZZZZ
MNNEGKHALWMPSGSVRALIAIGLTVAAVSAVFVKIDSETVKEMGKWAMIAWVFYFGVRAGETHPQE